MRGVVVLLLLGLALASASSTPQPTPAPAVFFMTFHTDVNVADPLIVLNVTRYYSPHGADRLWQLAQAGYYNENGFFRVLPGFVVQFGISGNPAVSKEWENANIPDDPVILSNTIGTFAFASAGPNTRTTQLFINYGDNSRLDGMGFSPCGSVISGMAAAQAIYSGYGQNPNQQMIYNVGNNYLHNHFPKLNYIMNATYSLTPPARLRV